MKSNQLTAFVANRRPRRAGRGIAAGRGKTAGRGTKGQNSRSGGRVRPGFEGGQNPLVRRLPKLPGFRSHRQPAQNVYTGDLEALPAGTITADFLADQGLVDDPYRPVKLIVGGQIKKARQVELQAASATAVAQLEATGGSFKAVARLQRPKSQKAGKNSPKQSS